MPHCANSAGAEILEKQVAIAHGLPGSREENALWQELEEKIAALMSQAAALANDAHAGVQAAEAALGDLLAWRALFLPESGRPGDEAAAGRKYLREHFLAHLHGERLFLVWCLLRRATGLGTEGGRDAGFRFNDWGLAAVLDDVVRGLGIAEEAIRPSSLVLGAFCAFAGRVGEYAARLDGAGEKTAAATVELVKAMIADDQVRALLQVNRYREDLYFSREGLALFSDWLRVVILWELHIAAGRTRPGQPPEAEILELLNYLPALAGQAEYKLEKFLEKLARLGG